MFNYVSDIFLFIFNMLEICYDTFLIMWAIVEGLPERLTTNSTNDKLHHMVLQHGWLLF
jgi:hypothetical protein